MGGLSVDDEDIIAWNGGGGSSFSRYFDGSDVGLSGLKLDAFAVIGSDEILMSFTNAGSVPGVAGTVDDSDIVLFTATSLGESTAGSFSLYFDGSDVGLSKRGEDIDAIELLENGHLLVSTQGGLSVSGASGKDEDILEFTPTSLGASTSGSWATYFDGSDVGLGSGSEDVDAMGLDATGKIYLSTVGNFTANGLSGADEDVFGFTPTSLGSATVGNFDAGRFFDGSLFGLGTSDLYAIDLP